MARSKKTATTVTYGDHEVILPENKLRDTVSEVAQSQGDDPVARAERALAELSSEFAGWMESECERLDAARRAIAASGMTPANSDALFRAAHDIKGEATTFGFPAIVSAAESLCRLIEHAPEAGRIPGSLIEQHVDAIRAIYREHTRSDATGLADKLSKRLREVTDEFLAAENRDRPDVLKMLNGPPIVPDTN
jgi:HPt (histidine-containing phosphotransfer) domain-containing protein